METRGFVRGGPEALAKRTKRHRRTDCMKRGLLVFCCFAGFIFTYLQLHADELEKNFTHPPDSARPWVNWFWLNGNISREGITADLEAMQRVGIGGVLLMDVSQDIPPGPVAFGS